MNRRKYLDIKIQQLQDELSELINERKNIPEFNVDNLSWKNILNTGGKLSSFRTIEDAARAADNFSYPYYSWNDYIYETEGNFEIAIYDRETDTFKSI